MTFSFTLLRFFSHFLGPTEDIPVKVTGNVNNGFTAESVPIEVGIYMILLEYKGLPPTPTPLYSTKILWIPTSIGSDPAVNPFLTLLVTLTGVQQGLEIRGFWFQKKTVQLKTVLREVYTYVLNEIFFKKQCIFKAFFQNPCFVRLHLCTKGDSIAYFLAFLPKYRDSPDSTVFAPPRNRTIAIGLDFQSPLFLVIYLLHLSKFWLYFSHEIT